jgi:anti-anti-sigma factor
MTALDPAPRQRRSSSSGSLADEAALTCGATFCFVGAKGGCGTTTICTELAKSAAATTAVLDGDLNGMRNVAVLCGAVNKLDLARRSSRFGPVRCGDVTIAELACDHRSGALLRAEDVEALVKQLEASHLVLADLPTPLAPAIRPLIARATRLFIVTEPTLLGIANAGMMIARLCGLGVPRARLAAIVNIRAASVVTADELQHQLEIPAIATIPRSTSRGFQTAVDSLARSLASMPKEPPLDLVPPFGEQASTPIARVDLVGELDIFRLEEIARTLPDPRRLEAITIDCRHASYIDSSVLGLLVQFRKAFVSGGGDPGRLTIVLPKGSTAERTFEITGLMSQFAVVRV